MISQKPKSLWGRFCWQIKRIPWYGWVASAILFGFHFLFYFIAGPIVKNWSVAWAYVPQITKIDGSIPYVPYFFAQIYLLAYIFWIIAPLVASVILKERFINYFLGLTAAYIIGFIFFAFLPTGINRYNFCGVDLIETAKGHGNSFSWACARLIQTLDKNDAKGWVYNLCPSYHCMLSTYAFLSIFRQKERSIGTRSGFLVMAICVCLSTLFVRQHCIIDVLSGVLLSVVCYLIFDYFNPGKTIMEKHPNFLVIKRKNAKSNKTKSK